LLKDFAPPERVVNGRLAGPGRRPSWDPDRRRWKEAVRGGHLVNVLVEDPDLAQCLGPERRRDAMVYATVRAAKARPGPWLPRVRLADGEALLGLLVLQGMILARMEVGGHASVEVLGPGDVIRPLGDSTFAMVPSETHWSIKETARFAVLDERFLRSMAPYPEVFSALCDRLERRARGLAERLAIAHERRVSARLYLVLWQLADRFGRVGRDGVILPLRLSHSVLADMVAAGRPPVSRALAELERCGLIRREGDRSWWLGGSSPSGLAQTVAARRRPGH
jgi:CRP/FNR family transcriptional regulator, cyclic AMP receptor protein